MNEETKINKKIPAAFVVVAIIVVASFLAVFSILREKSGPKLGNNRECPALAKICPDGKAAKMNPETCEFEACPEENSGQKQDEMVGNDRDEHGCIGSAGYSWCEEKQKCLRSWEESCETADINTSNWKTYKNDKYRFAVKYPKNWFVKDCPENNIFKLGVSFDDQYSSIQDVCSCDYGNEPCYVGLIYLMIEDKDPKIENTFIDLKQDGYNESNVLISGINARRISKDVARWGNYSEEVYFEKDKFQYYIGYAEFKETGDDPTYPRYLGIFNAMLSSLAFK